MKEYAVIIERTGTGFGAYVPDLPGCYASAPTVEEVTKLMGEAIAFHIETLTDRGQEVPEPSTIVRSIEFKAA